MSDKEKIRIFELVYNDGNYFTKMWSLDKWENDSELVIWLGWRFLTDVDIFAEEHRQVLRKDKLLKLKNYEEIEK